MQTPVALSSTEFNEHEGVLSPDGRWMAYASDQSGRSEVYVGAFPTWGFGENRYRLWREGPKWRRDGQELFYVRRPDAHGGDGRDRREFK